MGEHFLFLLPLHFFHSLLQTAHAPYASVHLGYANLETGSKWSCPRRSGSGINIACGQISRHWIERYMGAWKRRQSEGWKSNYKPCDIISDWRRKRRSAHQQYREIQSALGPSQGPPHGKEFRKPMEILREPIWWRKSRCYRSYMSVSCRRK